MPVLATAAGAVVRGIIEGVGGAFAGSKVGKGRRTLIKDIGGHIGGAIADARNSVF